VPSLDLRFADNKSLVDATTGASLVTFTRASSGTFVGSDGLIKTAVTNLLTYSEQFDNAAWTKTNSTVTTNATTAPNGTLTAEKLITNSGASSGRASVSITAAANTSATLSCFAKQGETSVFGLFISDGVTGRAADFDLITGTVSGTPTAGMTASIQPVGNGWYRCVVTVDSASLAGTTRSLRIVQTVISNDGTSGLFIFGAQFEQSSTVGEYIPTVAAINSAPRFDHNPTTGESLGLLVEEARTNLSLRSQELGDAAWTKTLSSITADATIAPNGTTTADKLVEDSSTGTHNIVEAATITYTSGLAYTFSFFIKKAERQTVQIVMHPNPFPGSVAQRTAIFNSNTGAFVSVGSAYTGSSVTAFSAGWYRVSVSSTSDATATGNFTITLCSDDIGTSSYTGDGTSGLFLWGAQLETGAFATSYIPTTSATVTRAADVAIITGANFSSWYNQTEGTVFGQFLRTASTNSQQGRVFNFDDGTNTNALVIYQTGPSNPSAAIIATTTQALWTPSGFTVGTSIKEVLGYQLNNSNASFNGSAETLDTVCNIPTVTQARIGDRQDGVRTLNGTIQRLTYWPTRLADTTLQQITQP
jgi:hypothetical protein